MAMKRDSSGWSSKWLAGDTPINWEIPGNPKRPHGKSYERFQSYFGANTVKEYLDNGGTRGDLKYDWLHQFLSLGFDDETMSELTEIAKTPVDESFLSSSPDESDPEVIIEKALTSYKRDRKASSKIAETVEEDILS